MIVFLIAALVAILEVTAVPYAGVKAVTFNLPVIVLVFFSLKKGFRTGISLGIFFGIFTGIFGVNVLLLNVLLYGAAGFTVGYIGKWFYKEKLLTFLFMVFLSLVFIYFLQYCYKFAHIQMELNVLDYAFRIFAPVAVYTLAVSIFLFYFLKELKV